MKQTEQQLEQAALGNLPPQAVHSSAFASRTAAFAIAPTVSFDDDSSNTATVIEVSGRDRPGLLADLVNAISKARLDIASAHIDCYGERAVDAFYVTDRGGQAQLTPAQKTTIKKSLLSVLDSQSTAPKRTLARARASTAR